MTQPETNSSTDSSALAGISPELRNRPQWVVWRYEARDGKRTKVLYQPHALAERASSTDPVTWATFDEGAAKMAAANASDRRGVNRVDGLGFVFSADDPYVGVDLDGCVVNGELHPAAQAIVDRLDSYTERSPSGTGVHIIVRAELPPGTANRTSGPWGGSLEVYDHDRYFTVTGDGSGEIAERTAELAELAHEYLPERSHDRCADWDRPAPTEADDAIVLAAAREDRRFAAVFDGGTVPAGKEGDSDADFELCCRLAEIIGNEPRWIERLWGASALAGRDKFDRDDYRTRTIERAIAAADSSSSSYRKAKDEEDDFSSSRRLYKAKKNTRVRSDGGRPRVRGGSTHGGLRRAAR